MSMLVKTLCPDCGGERLVVSAHYLVHHPRCASCAALRRGRAVRLRRVKPHVHQLLRAADLVKQYVDQPASARHVSFALAGQYIGMQQVETCLEKLERDLAALAEAQMMELLEQRRRTREVA